MFSPTGSSSVCLCVCPLVVFSVGSFSRKLLERFLLWWKGSVVAKSDIIGLKGPKMAKVCQKMSGKVRFLELLPEKLSSIQITVFFQVQYLKNESSDCVHFLHVIRHLWDLQVHRVILVGYGLAYSGMYKVE